jgi:hypothetical protein
MQAMTHIGPAIDGSSREIVLVWAMSRTRREEWLLKAGQIGYERPMTPEEVAEE